MHGQLEDIEGRGGGLIRSLCILIAYSCVTNFCTFVCIWCALKVVLPLAADARKHEYYTARQFVHVSAFKLK